MGNTVLQIDWSLESAYQIVLMLVRSQKSFATIYIDFNISSSEMLHRSKVYGK